MIAASLERLLRQVPDDARVLDVGGWGKPLRRADVVIDQMPYDTRGLYGFDGEGPERFTEQSWVRRDVCSRDPWPFADKEFDFVVCSQTLEDLRDPIWVCSEMIRVGRAGYIEVPSRLEEQSYGIQGPWVGWGHHHWLVDVYPGGIQFVFKHHIVHGKPSAHFPAWFGASLTEEERVSQLWWEGGFDYAEEIFVDPPSLDRYLEAFVAEQLAARAPDAAAHSRSTTRTPWARVLGGVGRRLARRFPNQATTSSKETSTTPPWEAPG